VPKVYLPPQGLDADREAEALRLSIGRFGVSTAPLDKHPCSAVCPVLNGSNSTAFTAPTIWARPTGSDLEAYRPDPGCQESRFDGGEVTWRSLWSALASILCFVNDSSRFVQGPAALGQG
jgi:hypothetical protein